MMNNEKKDVVKLLITVVDRGRGHKITELLESAGLYLNFISLGRGTATSEILDYLGIGEIDKDVIFSLVPQDIVKNIIKLICEASGAKRPGNGIAYTVPLSGISANTLSVATDCLATESLLEETKMDNVEKYDLIIAAVNSGNTDNVMDAAREAGATGGTVLHAKSLSHDESQRFFGIFVQPDKEIVTILVKRDIKQAVMKNIIKETGINTEAKGIVFSVPAENITFLGK